MSELNEQAFATWAPDESPWSVWAKPILFVESAALPRTTTPGTAPVDVSRFPDERDGTALVIDLPGPASAALGVALAERGYRPVPLFNAGQGPGAHIDVAPIAAALLAAAGELPRHRIRSDAPPAFLLDAERMKHPPPPPGRFDNRWMVFPQDFPSATFLRSRGIGRVLLVQEGERPREDLAHVLLRWQRGGIELVLAPPVAPDEGRPLHVQPPSLFRRAWYRMLASMKLRRSNVGGFGAIVPVATATG